jgi:hypothetical protein
MTERYKSHIIPKQNSKGFRIIHEFADISKHKEALGYIRSFYKAVPLLDRNNRKVSLYNTVHGYPYGNPNMISLLRRFLKEDESKPNSILCGFDLTNFYHFITKAKLKNSAFSNLMPHLDQAFVSIGNSIEVLSQGSPLSQDISNMCLLETDLKIMALLNTFNTWTKRTETVLLNPGNMSQHFNLPLDYEFEHRYDIPIIYKSGSSYLSNLIGPVKAAKITAIYEKKEVSEVLRASYMRYVDNIYILVRGVEDIPSSLLKDIATALTTRSKTFFLKKQFDINYRKDSVSSTMSNRKMPILGLNASKRLKCSRYYLNNLRAGLFQFAQGRWEDIPQSLVSSVIYALYVDPRSHNRLRKCMKLIREKDLSKAPNAKILISFTDTKNKLTHELPSAY